MGDMQHFCLRWNNYQSSITSAFENLRDDEDFVDVTLACDGKSLKAHRVVLSACSPYFRELLKSTPCKHPVIVLQDVTYEDLAALVEFIYHGEVNVRQRSLSSFLKTAEILRVSGLTQQSEAIGLDKGGFLESRELTSQTNRKQSHPVYRQRERPSSLPSSPQQESLVPVKKCRSETTPNHQQSSETPPPPVLSAINSGGQQGEEEPPVDFSTTSSNNNNLKQESLGAQSPNSALTGIDRVKPEPADSLAESKEDSEESIGGHVAEYGEPPPIQPPLDHPPTPESLSQHNYLESKLFGPGFNFSMAAALAADSLAGLNSQHHGLPGGDGMAGTSSQGEWLPRAQWMAQRQAPRPASHQHAVNGAAAMANSDAAATAWPTNQGYQCQMCHKRYRTISSLRNHKSVYHRKTQLPKRNYDLI